MVVALKTAHASDLVASLDGAVAGPVGPVTLEIRRGETVVLAGRNGVGKTTLLRLVCGLTRPERGSLRVEAPIGYAPQSYRQSLLPWMSVHDNVGLLIGPGVRPDAREALIRDAAREVGLSVELLDRRPHRLSGGEQQLVALARAIAARPRTLLLDEPFSALDVAVRPVARETVRRYAAGASAAVVVVSHDLDEVEDLADRVIVLSGRPARIAADLRIDRERASDLRAALLALVGANGGPSP